MPIAINRHLTRLKAYVPGEQPTEPGWIKLNTNENPYPPAPEVTNVLRRFDPERARRYPPPDCTALRKAIGAALDWPADGVLITNGSDEALRVLAHAYLNAGDRVGMLWPTYSYYPLLGALFGAKTVRFKAGRSGEWPATRLDLRGIQLFFLANPNPPFGTFYEPERIEELVRANRRTLFVIDEAYKEFAGADCMNLLRRYDNVVLTRTFSKSHALAGLRVGFVLAHPARMAPLLVVCDSYNVNAMSQLAGLAAWEAADYYRRRTMRIVTERERTARRLRELEFDVLPSQGNFLFARHSNAKRLFLQLKERRILVRYFDTPETRDGLRITIGTRRQMDALIAALREIFEQR